jgi:hypothetical protein
LQIHQMVAAVPMALSCASDGLGTSEASKVGDPGDLAQLMARAEFPRQRRRLAFLEDEVGVPHSCVRFRRLKLKAILLGEELGHECGCVGNHIV